MASEIAGAFDEADRVPLVAAAYLHDIGYAPSLRVTGLHSLDGARYLRDVEMHARVVNLVAYHSCALIEAEERGLAAELLQEFDRERSAVSDALLYCDMTVGPRGERMTPQERFRDIRARYGEGHLVTRSIERSERDILDAIESTERLLTGAHAAG